MARTAAVCNGEERKKDMGSSRTREGNFDNLLNKDWTGAYV